MTSVDVDVVIVGAGIAGSAAAWWLTTLGRSVVVLEQFGADHAQGSSHGTSRIFRLAYADALYVDLARQALSLWRDVEQLAGTALIHTTGGLDHGNRRNPQALAKVLAARGVEHDLLTPTDAAQRWPHLRFDTEVLHQPDAGRIQSRAAVETFRTLAIRGGAELRFHTPAVSVEQQPYGALVATDHERYRCRTAVVAAGAWTETLTNALTTLPILTVTQEQTFHLLPREEMMHWPVVVHKDEQSTYAIPVPGEGFKVAEHHSGAITSAERRDSRVDPAARERIVDYARQWLPGVSPTILSETTCLYTSTANDDFLLDRVGNVVIASACSGHGFKFAPLLGKTIAQLALGEQAHSRFRLPVRV